VYLAALRRRMTALAAEIGDGAVFANVPRSRAAEALAPIPPERRSGALFIGNIVPVCIADDRRAAEAAMRRTVGRFVVLPYYRNYWIEAGYAEEMARLEAALAEQRSAEEIGAALDGRWLADVTLFGTAREVREGVAEWYAAGITPILAPASTGGEPLRAFAELFAAFA
jgi:alkanesulfonate monooxygenase SsuD/methylene tetrahydromethanopterin reductase-like flavin-dependent oxidoreductase (luciferase family)